MELSARRDRQTGASLEFRALRNVTTGFQELWSASTECRELWDASTSARALEWLHGLLRDKTRAASSECRKLLCKYHRCRLFNVSRAFACRACMFAPVWVGEGQSESLMLVSRIAGLPTCVRNAAVLLTASCRLMHQSAPAPPSSRLCWITTGATRASVLRSGCS